MTDLSLNDKQPKKKSKKKKSIKTDGIVSVALEGKENDVKIKTDALRDNKLNDNEPQEKNFSKEAKKDNISLESSELKSTKKQKKKRACLTEEIADDVNVKKLKKQDSSFEEKSEGESNAKRVKKTKHVSSSGSDSNNNNKESKALKTENKQTESMSKKLIESDNLNENGTNTIDVDKKKKKKKRKLPPLPDPQPGAFEAMLSVVTDSKANTVNTAREIPVEIDNTNEGEELIEIPKEKKKREKKEGIHVDEKKSAKVLALNYLHSWKNDKTHWTFKKVRQIWLLHHLYDEEAISSENFSILLEYLQGAKGAAKTKTIEEAEKLFNDISDTSDECNKIKYKRAREVVQFLSV